MHLVLKTVLFSSVFVFAAAVSFSFTSKVAFASSPVLPVAAAVAAKVSPERTLNLRFESERGTRNFTARLAANRCAKFEQKSARAELDLEVCQDNGQTLRVRVFEWVSTKDDTNKRRLSFSFNIDSSSLVPVASWQGAAGEAVTVSASVE